MRSENAEEERIWQEKFVKIFIMNIFEAHCSGTTMFLAELGFCKRDVFLV
jgi:hypothetical protein